MQALITSSLTTLSLVTLQDLEVAQSTFTALATPLPPTLAQLSSKTTMLAPPEQICRLSTKLA